MYYFWRLIGIVLFFYLSNIFFDYSLQFLRGKARICVATVGEILYMMCTTLYLSVSLITQTRIVSQNSVWPWNQQT